jgi:hypothetical protein
VKADHITLINSIFGVNVYDKLYDLAWLCIWDCLVFPRADSLDLTRNSTWHELNLITKSDSALLYLSMNNNTNLWIFLLVKYWDSQWTIRISWRNWKIIKYLEEMAIVRIPAANALIDNTVDVLT